MTAEKRLEAIAHNALADVLGRIDHWMILSERQRVADAVLAAVVPEVREQVAKEIEAHAGVCGREFEPRIWRALKRAANIARGER